jgi:hypothetical protein
MAFKQQDVDLWKRRFSRALVVGPPNSWKTSSLLTWPMPMAVVVYPGEKGSSSLPPTHPGLTTHVWEEDPLTANKPGPIVKAVEGVTLDVLSGTHGPITTFAGDGLHKLYEVYFDAAIAEVGDDERVRGRAFGMAHESFMAYLKRVLHSPVPYVVMTCWDGPEKDNPLADPKDKDAPKHLWPDFAGKLAKRIVGEFGAVLYAQPGTELLTGSGQRAKFKAGTWYTRPHGAVWGAGLKLPLAVAQRVPSVVPQDWTALEALVLGPTPPSPKPTGGPNA